jgi:large subunit ribosomal protein L19
MEQIIRALEAELLSPAEGEESVEKEIATFTAGDKIRVHERITDSREEGKERIQVFEGVVLQIRGKGTAKMFTVRKESFGIGVEKMYPLFSPKIKKVEMVEERKVRQARPFYLRQRRIR